jgi:hypothetical protein
MGSPLMLATARSCFGFSTGAASAWLTPERRLDKI